MIDWLRKLYGWFFPERYNAVAQGEEYRNLLTLKQEIIREQEREIKRLKAKVAHIEKVEEQQQEEINALKEELYLLRLKGKLDDRSSGKD